MSANGKSVIKKVILYLLLAVLSITFIIPFLWMARSSFMKLKQIFIMPPQWIPAPFTLEGYEEALTMTPFLQYALNTIIILALGTMGTILTSSMAAYSFSRVQWRGRELVFSLILSSMMLPGVVTLIPQFIGWKSLGLYNTFGPLIIPGWLGGGAFNIFLLRQFFLGIPKELDEAATIDGATHFNIFTRIMIPLCSPSLIVVGVFSFMNYWNDFFTPLIYLTNSNKYTLALGLQQLIGQYTSRWNVLMAASTMVIIPCVIVFIFGQKYLIEGISTTGIKG